MKVYFYTLGCRVNQYETDAARELFLRRGYESADDPEDADIIVVNTCTVTGEADRKSRQHLRKMARIRPDAVIVAMGCATEMTEGVVEADVVLGTRDKNLIVDKTEEFLSSAALQESRERAFPTTRPEVTKSDVYHDFGTVLSPEGTRAFIKIEDGCDAFCSYCIIPFARGRVASRSFESIKEEVSFLASKGFREISVSGIHLCSYGKDRGEDITALYEVLKMISGTEGIERIRLGSLEPMSMTPSFIDSLKDLKGLCPHFHLSLQSGSDTVLKRMNRKYDTNQYLERVALLREAFPSMTLTTDIICGFPGETDAEFDETVKFVGKAGINRIHVFPYSVREGTRAAQMEQLPAGTAKKRVAVLTEVSSAAEREHAASFTGKTREVLAEKVLFEDGEKTVEGYIPEYVRIRVKCPSDVSVERGDIVSAEITGCDGTVLQSRFLGKR